MDADDLYGLPLDRFVPERAALAKALRADGRRDEAARVAKLAKPSVAAWAVNQLVRTQRRAVAELFGAGDALQQAQADIVAGHGSAAALREAAARERATAADLTDVARGLLSAGGQALGAATLERVSETLHAAALEVEARAEVESGCLVRELRHVGMGGGAGAGTAPGGTRGRATADGTAAVDRAAAAEARRRRAEAERAEAKARRDAARAERDLSAATERRDRAADALRAADEALADARKRTSDAAATHREAQQALEGL